MNMFTRLALCIAAGSLLLAGCGKDGTNGTSGVDRSLSVIDAKKLTTDDLKNIKLGGKITSVDTSGDRPVVKFSVVNSANNQGVVGLTQFSLHIAQLKPAANGSASYWQNYIVKGLPLASIPAFTERGATTQTAPNNPSADAVDVYNADGTLKAKGYTVVDNQDGTYTVTFGAKIKENPNVPYDASLVHRVAINVRTVSDPANKPGAYAGPVDPTTKTTMTAFWNSNGAALVYDFIPATGAAYKDATTGSAYARDITTIGACNACHYKIELYAISSSLGTYTSGHLGGRPDTRICVVCHTNQLSDGKGNFTRFVHQIHMGGELPATEPHWWETGVNFSGEYPQNIKNCSTCHTGKDTNNWNTVPTRNACGSCHNNLNFATGSGHVGGSAADDKTCALCHASDAIKAYHVPVTVVPNANVASIKASYADNSNLPAGAYKIEYVASTLTVNANKTFSFKFQVKKDGNAVNFGTYNATTNPNIIPNMVGGPSIRFEFNVPQDGINSPADFNANISAPAIGVGQGTISSGVWTAPSVASNIWAQGGTFKDTNNITWTLTGPDASGFYTITSDFKLPATTTMLSAIMYGAMVQTNLADYPWANASLANFTSYVNTSGATAYVQTKQGLNIVPQVAKAAASSTGFTARRTTVDNSKCNACHKQLGLFGKSVFHGGARNDATICNICHTVNGVNGGWSYNSSTFVHAIHGASKRSKAYTFQGDWSGVAYPGLLKNCEACHVSGGYDYSAAASAAAVGKLLYTTVATGTIAATTTSPAPAGTYGSGLANTYNTGTAVSTEPAATTLVSSPIAAACYACHDSAAAKSHMVLNGGSVYEARSTALAKAETCLVCHGALSSTNASNTTTPAIKAVHRWW